MTHGGGYRVKRNEFYKLYFRVFLYVSSADVHERPVEMVDCVQCSGWLSCCGLNSPRRMLYIFIRDFVFREASDF